MEHAFSLPAHFRIEQERLASAGIHSWHQLAALDQTSLRQLGRTAGASEARLVRLQGQARLVVELDLAPPDAALLLHAGIATARGLQQADPHRLLQQIHRLQRQLTGRAVPLIDLATLRCWMVKAATVESGRSWN
jgi:Domain of unknown function (DUF4332)